MANFYNLRNSAGVFSLLAAEETAFTHNFNITATKLEYTFKNLTENKVLCSIELELDNLKSNPRFCSQSLWAFQNRGFLGEDTSLYTIETINLISIFDITKNDKSQRVYLKGDNYSEIPFRIFVDSKDGDFTSFSYLVANPDPTLGQDIGHTTTVITNIGTPPTDVYTEWKSVIAPITLSTTQSSVQAGDIITVNVSTDESLDKIYLEQITGILDRTVVKLNNGIGSFNILTNTLSSGDTVEIKAGHKLFTGVTNFTKTLV
jgi:hypothetical protein